MSLSNAHNDLKLNEQGKKRKKEKGCDSDMTLRKGKNIPDYKGLSPGSGQPSDQGGGHTAIASVLALANYHVFLGVVFWGW